MNALSPKRPDASRPATSSRLTIDTDTDLGEGAETVEILLDDMPPDIETAQAETGSDARTDADRNGPTFSARSVSDDAAVSPRGSGNPPAEPWPERETPRVGGAQVAAGRAAAIPARLSGIEVTLTVELGRRQVPIRELLDSAPGQLFALESLTDDPVDVLVNGRLFARGEVIQQGERYAVKLISLAGQEG